MSAADWPTTQSHFRCQQLLCSENKAEIVGRTTESVFVMDWCRLEITESNCNSGLEQLAFRD